MFLLLAVAAIAAIAVSQSSSSAKASDPLADPLAYDLNAWNKAFSTVDEPLRSSMLANLQNAQKKDVPALLELATMFDAMKPPQTEAAKVLRARAKAIAAGNGP